MAVVPTTLAARYEVDDARTGGSDSKAHDFSNNEEIFVKLGNHTDLPMDLFRSYPPLPEPYPYRPGVDYEVEAGFIWHCDRGHGDFNAARSSKWGPAYCPACGWPAEEIIVVSVQGRDLPFLPAKARVAGVAQG